MSFSQILHCVEIDVKKAYMVNFVKVGQFADQFFELSLLWVYDDIARMLSAIMSDRKFSNGFTELTCIVHSRQFQPMECPFQSSLRANCKPTFTVRDELVARMSDWTFYWMKLT